MVGLAGKIADADAAAARDFADLARRAASPAAAIQNAFKAAEYAVNAAAPLFKRRRPATHDESKNLAYKISIRCGKSFGRLLVIYLGSCRHENGARMKKALELMEEVFEEVRKLGVKV